MKRWTTVAVLAVATTFALSTLNPTRAEAIDTGEILIWSAAGAGAIAAIVLIATLLTRDDSTLFLTEPPTDIDAQTESKAGIHFGPECRNPDGTVALLCW